MKKIFKYLVLFVSIFLLVVLLINIYVLSFSKNYILDNISDLEKTEVWLVFWARVMLDWTPSDILKDRLEVALKAYENKKISKIIVSWDNSKDKYDETTSMSMYLINKWINSDDIYLDYAWFDSYDSLFRVKELFWVKKIILFTQEFHLKRTIYISKRLWIDTVWISTDLQKYIHADYYNRREILARVKAFLDVEIFKSAPKFLGDKIDMSKPQEEISNK